MRRLIVLSRRTGYPPYFMCVAEPALDCMSCMPLTIHGPLRPILPTYSPLVSEKCFQTATLSQLRKDGIKEPRIQAINIMPVMRR